MTPRTFWAILIKIMGVYAIIESFIAIPQFLTAINYFISTSAGQGDRGPLLYGGGFAIIIVCIYILVIRYSIFKTDIIIDKLKLDTGYEDERLEFNIHRSTLLKIVVMVTGGWLLIDNFPTFCNQVLYYIQRQGDYGYKSTQNPATGYLIAYFIKIVIGYFMLTCSRMIINFIEVRRRKSVVIGEDEGE